LKIKKNILKNVKFRHRRLKKKHWELFQSREVRCKDLLSELSVKGQEHQTLCLENIPANSQSGSLGGKEGRGIDLVLGLNLAERGSVMRR